MNSIRIETSWSSSYVGTQLVDVEKEYAKEGGKLILVTPETPGSGKRFAISVEGRVTVRVIKMLIDAVYHTTHMKRRGHSLQLLLIIADRRI